MPDITYTDYLTDLTNLDYSAGFTPEYWAPIDHDLNDYYKGRDV